MGKKTYKHPRQYTTETFKARLKEIYGNKFGLEFVEYNGAYKPIILVCPIHGKFSVRACIAARGKASCKKCANIEKSLESRTPFNIIRERILNTHNGISIDENQEYKNTHTKIKVVCSKHGEFEMTPNSLLSGQSCPKCGKENAAKKRKGSLKWLINESKKIHGDKYTFDKFIYKNTKTKGIVTCIKHGDFLITPDKLLHAKQGCPICSTSKLEREFKDILDENNENYIYRCGAKTFSWLKRQHLDFYLPKYNIAVECQGIQHYQPVRFGGISEEDAEKQLNYVNSLDKRKKEICDKNNVTLTYLKYDDDIYKFYKSIVNKE